MDIKNLFTKKRKILPNNKETRQYLDSLPKVYIIAHWANWGVREYPFAKRFTYACCIDNNGAYIVPLPMVYDYFDCNGMLDEYHLKPINHVTAGTVVEWTFNKNWAYECAEMLNAKEEKELEAQEMIDNADHRKQRGRTAPNRDIHEIIAHWVEKPLKNYPDIMGLWCSNCDESALGEYKYCPHCGAKMKIEIE